MLFFAANTNLGYRIFSYANKKFTNIYLLGLSQNQMPQGSSLVNPTTDRKIVMKQRPCISAFCTGTPNRFGLKLYDVLNYSDITFPTFPPKYTREACFTDVLTITKNFRQTYRGSKLFVLRSYACYVPICSSTKSHNKLIMMTIRKILVNTSRGC